MTGLNCRFIIHDLAQACAVLEQAQRLPATELTLESPPGAALVQGIAWFAAIETECRGRYPGVACRFVIDCADAPGLALAALRMGFRHLRARLDGPALLAVRDVAQQSGATLETEAAQALDLGRMAHVPGAIAAYFVESSDAQR